MKKLSFLLLLMLIIMTALPVYAEGIGTLTEKGDKVGIFNSIKVDKPVNGNVIAVFGDVEVRNSVNGEVVAVFGNVRVDGKVEGQVVAIFGDITMAGDAVVGGNTVALGTINRMEGSRINGQEVNVNLGSLNFGSSTVILIISAFSLLVLLIGLPFLIVFNKRFTTISFSIELDIGKRMAIGFLLTIASILLLPLLAITVIGLLMYIILLITSEIVVCIYFGKAILKTIKSVENIIIQFITGYLFISLIKSFLVLAAPNIGIAWTALVFVLLGLFAHSLGIGILFDTRIGQETKPLNLER